MKNKFHCLWCIAAAILLVPTITAFAAANSGGGQDKINSLKAAQGADQLLVAVGDPGNPAKTTLSYYERGEDGKLTAVFSIPAVSGYGGISSAKTEGDKKTPAGVYSFTMAFGLKEDPGTILPYHQIVSGDYLVDDPASRYYNQLVNENQVKRDWKTGENLIRQAPHYNYGLILNYNEECEPGKGSAIFLHCSKAFNNTGTSGCISVPEDYVKELLKRVDAGTRIVIAPDEAALAEY